MSCECEKLRQLYERFGSEKLEIITQAKNHVYGSSLGNGLDITESQMFEPKYEDGRSGNQNAYHITNTDYSPNAMNMQYDIAPAKMPAQSYAKAKNKDKSTDNTGMLEDLITKAKEEAKWMSTTR